MLETGATHERAQRVHDAIGLHLKLNSGDDPRPEIAGVHLGALIREVNLLDLIAAAPFDS